MNCRSVFSKSNLFFRRRRGGGAIIFLYPPKPPTSSNDKERKKRQQISAPAGFVTRQNGSRARAFFLFR